MFRRLKNLWRLSNLDINPPDSTRKILQDVVKELTKVKKMATVVEDKPEDLFPTDVKTD